MSTIAIKYVGKKPVKRDNVTASGLTWGSGEVVRVPFEYVDALLKHTDVWQKASKDDDQPDEVPEPTKKEQDERNEQLVRERQERDHEEDEQDEREQSLMPNITRMNKDALLKLAKRRFGETLNKDMQTSDMRSRITALENAGRAV